MGPTVHTAIEALVQEHAEAYPELGLSFGYIGNVYRDGTDDRSWRVFTNQRSNFGRSISWGSCSTEHLVAMLERIKAGALTSFCEHLRAMMPSV